LDERLPVRSTGLGRGAVPDAQPDGERDELSAEKAFDGKAKHGAVHRVRRQGEESGEEHGDADQNRVVAVPRAGDGEGTAGGHPAGDAGGEVVGNVWLGRGFEGADYALVQLRLRVHFELWRVRLVYRFVVHIGLLSLV